MIFGLPLFTIFKSRQVSTVDSEEKILSDPEPVIGDKPDEKPILEVVTLDEDIGLTDLDLTQINGAEIQEKSKNAIARYRDRTTQIHSVAASSIATITSDSEAKKDSSQNSASLSRRKNKYRRHRINSAGSRHQQVGGFSTPTSFSTTISCNWVSDAFVRRSTELVGTKILITDQPISSTLKTIFFVPELKACPTSDCDIIALLDVSTSMNARASRPDSDTFQTRLDVCKSALSNIVDYLNKAGDTHRMAIARFNHVVYFDTPGLLNVSTKTETLKQVIHRAEAKGGTNIFSAFQQTLIRFAKTHEQEQGLDGCLARKKYAY